MERTTLTTPTAPARRRTMLREQLRAARAARAERRSLARDLASYTSPRELNDLEAMLQRYSDGDTADIRRIVSGRRAAHGSNHRAPAGRTHGYNGPAA